MNDAAKPWLLLPVKSLRHGKSRLAGVFDDVERWELNRFLLGHMLEIAAEFPGLQRTVVVSDGDDTLSLARETGAHPLRHHGSRGLNAAVTKGVAELRSRGARKILVMPADLPLVDATDLREFVSRGSHRSVVLCRDRRLAGTNAILLPASARMKFCFGVLSYARHRCEVRRSGLVLRLHDNQRIAADIDVPSDLDILRERPATPSGILQMIERALRRKAI
jgi:2-phospho-L-lactate/phosphoenolpyruvate guanylyltransferase